VPPRSSPGKILAYETPARIFDGTSQAVRTFGTFRKGLATILSVLTLAGATALAQPAPGRLALTVGGGLSLPCGDFSDAFDTGYLVLGGCEYAVAPRLCIGTEIGYRRYGLDKEAFDYGIPGIEVRADGHAAVWQGTVSGRYVLNPGRSGPYLKGTVGLYRSQASGTVQLTGPGTNVAEETTGRRESDFGFAVGAGYSYRSEDRTAFFIEVLFNHVATERDRSALIHIAQAGDGSQFIDLRGGVSFHFGP
jgi:opacity protein-like surface antigen